jgi:hypothetical protein
MFWFINYPTYHYLLLTWSCSRKESSIHKLWHTMCTNFECCITYTLVRCMYASRHISQHFIMKKFNAVWYCKNFSEDCRMVWLQIYRFEINLDNFIHSFLWCILELSAVNLLYSDKICCVLIIFHMWQNNFICPMWKINRKRGCETIKLSFRQSVFPLHMF